MRYLSTLPAPFTRILTQLVSAQNVRLMNVDTRLSAVQVEKDDMQQERDSETQRAKALEHRASALQDKLGELMSSHLNPCLYSWLYQRGYRRR